MLPFERQQRSICARKKTKKSVGDEDCFVSHRFQQIKISQQKFSFLLQVEKRLQPTWDSFSRECLVRQLTRAAKSRCMGAESINLFSKRNKATIVSVFVIFKDFQLF